MAALTALEIFEEWQRDVMPKNVLQTDRNAEAIGGFIRKHFNGVVSFNNLNATVQRLAANNELELAPVQVVERIVEKIVEVERKPTEKEIRQKQRDDAERAGIRRYGSDRTEFDRPSKSQQQRLDAQREHEALANNTAAKAEFDRIVSNHSVDGPGGRTNHSETARQKDALKAIFIADSNGKPNYVAMIQEARAMQKKWERLGSSIR
jgi:hypothetical protein